MIDLVLSNEENMVSDLNILSPLGKSDHSLIAFQYHYYTQNSTVPCQKFVFDKGNYTELNKQLQIDWDETLKNDHDADSKWAHFEEILNTSITAC